MQRPDETTARWWDGHRLIPGSWQPDPFIHDGTTLRWRRGRTWTRWTARDVDGRWVTDTEPVTRRPSRTTDLAPGLDVVGLDRPEIGQPVKGWNPVPGDPRAIVWWDGSAITAEARRVKGRWEVVAGRDPGIRWLGSRPGWRLAIRSPSAIITSLAVGLAFIVAGLLIGAFSSVGSALEVLLGLAIALLVVERRYEPRAPRVSTPASQARRARWPITLWFWLVVLGALGSVVPTAMAQQDFGQYIRGTTSCAPEPWPVNEHGMQALVLYLAILAAVVLLGLVGFLQHRSVKAGDPTAQRMLWLALALAVLIPTAWWVVLYMLAGMNCGL